MEDMEGMETVTQAMVDTGTAMGITTIRIRQLLQLSVLWVDNCDFAGDLTIADGSDWHHRYAVLGEADFKAGNYQQAVKIGNTPWSIPRTMPAWPCCYRKPCSPPANINRPLAQCSSACKRCRKPNGAPSSRTTRICIRTARTIRTSCEPWKRPGRIIPNDPASAFPAGLPLRLPGFPQERRDGVA